MYFSMFNEESERRQHAERSARVAEAEQQEAQFYERLGGLSRYDRFACTRKLADLERKERLAKMKEPMKKPAPPKRSMLIDPPLMVGGKYERSKFRPWNNKRLDTGIRKMSAEPTTKRKVLDNSYRAFLAREKATMDKPELTAEERNAFEERYLAWYYSATEAERADGPISELRGDALIAHVLAERASGP